MSARFQEAFVAPAGHGETSGATRWIGFLGTV